MLEQDMLSQLAQLLSKLSLTNRSTKTAIQGQIIQLLKPITYFKNEAQTYGTEILKLYIPLIQPYALRAGMQIISTKEDYAILEGIVQGRRNNGEIGSIYTEGMLVDPSAQDNKCQGERQVFCSALDRDTKMVKISRNMEDSRVNKYTQILAKFQKDRLQRNRQILKLNSLDKNFQNVRAKLKNFQFFQSLGNFDIIDLINQSRLVTLPKSSTVHNFGEQVTRLSFIISGSVKIDNSVIHEKSKPVQAGRLILQKYMIHKKQHNSTVISFAQAGQWIGLQQYLWKQRCFLSKAQVCSHDAQILYVKTQTFTTKFNELTNFYLINKLKSLIETKKKLLDKTIRTKKQKQIQILQQKSKNQALQKIKQKIRQNQNKDKPISQTKQRNLTPKMNKQSFLKIRSRKVSNFPKQCYMPQAVVHKVKVFQQKYSSLPKITERFTLFPEQYQKARVPLQLRDQLKMMKMARNKNQVNKNSEKRFRLLNSSKVYQTVIFASLSPKNENPEKQKGIPIMKSKLSLQFEQILSLVERNQSEQAMNSTTLTSRTHFNDSIFNNFRAPKNKGQKLLQNLSKTLQII